MLTLGIWLLSLLKFGCYRENKRREEKSISGRHWKLLPPPSLSNQPQQQELKCQKSSTKGESTLSVRHSSNNEAFHCFLFLVPLCESFQSI